MADQVNYNGYAILKSKRTDNMDGERVVGWKVPIYIINKDETLTRVARTGIITRKHIKKLDGETKQQRKQRLFGLIKIEIDKIIANKNKEIPVVPEDATDEEMDSATAEFIE